jgi:hypothetical protein
MGELAANEKARWLELVKFLAQHGLYGIAQRLRDDGRLGVRTVFQLGDLGEKDLAVIEWLSVVEQRTLVRICEEEAAKRMSGVDTSDARSAESGADTMEAHSDSSFSTDDECVCENTVVGMRNEGDIVDLESHLTQLAIKFKASEKDLCTGHILLLVEFMQGATFPDPESEQKWRASCSNDAETWFLFEGEIRVLFDCVVSDARFLHPLLERSGFSSRTCSPHVFVLDLMVRRCGPRAVDSWDEQVVQGLDLSVEPLKFLERASKFLRDGMNRIMRGGG